MGSNSKKAYGAAGRDEMLWFHPEDLVLVRDPLHPLYDPRVDDPLEERLVLNIMFRGIIEPVVVRKNGEKNGVPVVEVVDGRQRVRAALEANKRLKAEGKELLRVPAVRRRGEDVDLFGVMVSANEIRREDSPIVKAKKLARYIGFGRSEAEAAITFGVSETTIQNWLALLDCSKEVKQAVEAQEIPSKVAVKLAKLPREEQKTALAKVKGKKKKVRGKAAEKAADAATGHKPRPRSRSRKTVEALLDSFECAAEKLPSAVAVLKWLLGDDKALSTKWIA